MNSELERMNTDRFKIKMKNENINIIDCTSLFTFGSFFFKLMDLIQKVNCFVIAIHNHYLMYSFYFNTNLKQIILIFIKYFCTSFLNIIFISLIDLNTKSKEIKNCVY